METKNYTAPPRTSAREVVLSCVKALNEENFDAARKCVSDDMTFVGVLGSRNGAELWRRLQGQSFQGSLRVVGEWTTRRRRAEKATNQQLQKVPSARTISRLMTTVRDNLSKADTVTIAAIEARVPTLVEARMLVESFQAMVRKKLVADLDPWIATASLSLIASFASGIIRDKAAVRAAITEPWSNGQTEGQITKLKLVKRQMYGRAKIDLLQARLIGAI